MKFLSKFDLKLANVLKVAGLVVAALVVLVFALSLISALFKSSFGIGAGGGGVVPFGISSGALEPSYSRSAGVAVEDAALGIAQIVDSKVDISPPLPPPRGGGTTGDDAEEFEVTEYSAHVETRRLKEDCETVAGLKAREYVIFESANEHERGCSYTFKVRHENADEILLIVKGLRPKELSESTYTIKRVIENIASEEEILGRKLASINETLEDAIRAYDDITAVATRARDAESLAKIIDSKIRIVERLTQERINTAAQLERISRSKAEQLDRLEYTYFHVNIFENKFVDIRDLKDSWKATIKEFVRDINETAQNVTINLVALLFLLLQYALYLLILLVAAKYGWKIGKRIWQK